MSQTFLSLIITAPPRLDYLASSAGFIEVSPERPYLGLRLDLEPALVASVMLEASIPFPPREAGSVGPWM
jgi:hypothetical protein